LVAAVILWVKLTKLTADGFVKFAAVGGILGFRSRGVFTQVGELLRGRFITYFELSNALLN